ncbi:MAG: glycosyltransferase family 4 protein [Solirubrobacteraceae bacterium]
MRVVVVTPDYPPARGGIQRLLGELVKRADWQSLVVTGDHPEALDGVRTHRVKVIPGAGKASTALLNAVAVQRGRGWRPDAVLSGHIAVSPGATVLGRALHVPVVQYVYAKELTSRPRVARFALARAAATIAISDHTAGLAIEAGAPASRIVKIVPGVDSVAVGPSATPARRPTILTVARLTDRYKGFDVMLRALPLVRSRVPDVQWVVIGDGELRAELEAAAAWDLSDTVHFAGTVIDARRDALFGSAHVFAMPSRVPADGGGEGYGLVYLEAGARGLPCVAGDRGAVAEAVVHGETGLLVDGHDHVDLADALVDLLSDPPRAARLGQAGRARAHELSWDRMARQVERVFDDAVAAWPRHR